MYLYLTIGLFVLAAAFYFQPWKKTVSYSLPRILMYHMVSDHKPGAKFNKLRVTAKNFEQQLRWLAENGWQFVFASEINLTNEPHSSAKKIAITFDDGFADNYDNALPLLKKYNAKATLYLVVDRHDRDWSVYKKEHHNSGELKGEPKLTDQQVAEMLDSGLIELGGHTVTHANLSRLSMKEKHQEIAGCKRMLESTFSTKVPTFAYPFGIYDQQDELIVKNSGYAYAVLAEGGIDRPDTLSETRLKRIKVSGKDSLHLFKRKIRTGRK